MGNTSEDKEILSTLRNHVGVGLRQPHFYEVLEFQPSIPWFEVHTENYLYRDSVPRVILEEIRKEYPISLHGIGLSLGSADGLDLVHVQRVKETIDVLDPVLVSDHLSWSRVGSVYLPDLLPVPYTQESFKILDENISRVQETLKRSLLIENPSTYIEFKDSEFLEVDFLISLCKKTGSKVLLDVNNVFVSCTNHGWNAEDYIDALPKDLVGEIHLAGHSQKEVTGGRVRIDDHGEGVSDSVLMLFDRAIKRLGPVPTLIEWDNAIPPLHVLQQEAEKAESIIRKNRGLYAVA